MVDKGARFGRELLSRAGRKVLGTITHVGVTEPVAALTFDDGPHPQYTPHLCDLLERYQARGTIFMVGKSAQSYPEVVRRVASGGHAIGNHTWDHPSMPRVSSRERRAQLRTCAQAIAPYNRPQLFRPPYGHQSFASRVETWLLGYQVITWSVVGQDWLDHPAQMIADRLLNQIRPGSIILLHDTLYTFAEERFADRMPMFEAVEMLLTQLRGQFDFITVPELLRRGRPQRQNWYQQGDTSWLHGLKTPEGEARRYAAG